MSFGSDSPGGGGTETESAASEMGRASGDSGAGFGGGGGGFGGGFGGGGDFGGGFASEYGPSGGLGGFDFGGWGDPGTAMGFGDVGFGAGGTGYAGEGFGDLGFDPTSDLSRSLASLPVKEQERVFRTMVEPTLSKWQGWQGQVASQIAKSVFGTLANAAIPGFGTLSRVTGLTGYLADKMMDMSFAQDLGEQLGLKSADAMSMISEAEGKGLSGQDIVNAARNVAIQRGEDMGIWEDITGGTAAEAATGAAGTQAGYQQQALDYLKQMGAIPLQAQQQLAGVYGLPGGVGDQQQMIGQAQASPLYGAIMGGQQAGEEAIMRQAGATGGLRSGNVQAALADYNTQLQNQALMQAYGQQMGGLTGLAEMGTYAPQVASGMAGIGGTLAEGQIEAAKAEQAGMRNLIGLGGTAYKTVGGLGGLLEAGRGIGTAYSTAGGGVAGLGAAGSELLDTITSWF